MIAPGRNDACHCGSGKKYKKCHLVTDQNRTRTEKALTTLPERVSFHTSELIEAARPIAADFETLPAAAHTVFGDAQPADVFADGLFGHHALFDLKAGAGAAVSQVTVTGDDEFSQQKRALRDLLAATHTTIYTVMAVKAGKGVRLRDELLRLERWLPTPELADQLEPLETLCGRVVTIEKTNLLLDGWERIAFHKRRGVVAQLKAAVDGSGFDADDRKSRTLWVKAKGAETIAACRQAA